MIHEAEGALKVFFSYSHKDQELRDQLETHLSLLKRQGFISSWHDRKILAGAEWAEDIDAHLNTAQVILLLISADFLASSYCYDIEVKRAMERHSAGEARVIPIILRHCDWQPTPFGKLQALPPDGKPIESRYWHTKDEAFLAVAQGIRKAIEGIRSQYTPMPVSDAEIRKAADRDTKLSLPKIQLNQSFNPYEVRDEWIEYITANLQEAIAGEKTLNFYADGTQGYRQIRIVSNQKTIYSLDIHKGFMGGSRSDDGISFTYAEGRVPDKNSFHATGNFKWNRQKRDVVLELLDMSLISFAGGNKEYTKEEFLHALWEKIRQIIERSF